MEKEKKTAAIAAQKHEKCETKTDSWIDLDNTFVYNSFDYKFCVQILCPCTVTLLKTDHTLRPHIHKDMYRGQKTNPHINNCPTDWLFRLP